MTEEQLQAIEACLARRNRIEYEDGIFARDIRALIAEVRRLREQNKALDPYGRGVVSKSTEF